MAKRVKIARVDGNYAVTESGQRLRIIGNARPGQYAFTDGVVVYGYSPIGSEYRFLKRKKPDLLLPIYDYDVYSSGYAALAGLGGINIRDWQVTVPSIDIQDYQKQVWLGRNVLFNDKTKFYSLRGSYYSHDLYVSGRERPVYAPSKALFLGHDDHGMFFWQTGSYCWSKATMEAVTYPELNYVGSEYDYDLSTPDIDTEPPDPMPTPPPVAGYVDVYEKVTRNYDLSDWYVKRTFAMSSSIEDDLRLVYGTLDGMNRSINVKQVVDTILNRVGSMLKNYQEQLPDDPNNPGQPDPDFPTTPYFNGPPDPVLCDFSLDTTEPFIGSGNGDIICPPCDSDYAHGGNPNCTPDWWNIPEFEDEWSMDPYDVGGDYRVIHNVVRHNGSIQFEIGIRAHFMCFPVDFNGALEFEPVPDPDNPPSPVPTYYLPRVQDPDGEYLWTSEGVAYTGRWIVGNDGSSLTEISREIYGFSNGVAPSGVQEFEYEKELGNGFKAEYRLQYEYDPNDHSVITDTWLQCRIKKGMLTLPQRFVNVYAVVPYDDSTVLVIADLDSHVEQGSENYFVYQFRNRSVVLLDKSRQFSVNQGNTNCIFTEDYSKMAPFFNALRNIPYYGNS